MKRIDINIIAPGKGAEDGADDDTQYYAGYPAVDEVLGAPAKLILKFYDAGTYWDDGTEEWKELTQFMTDYSTTTKTVDIDQGVYSGAPEYYTHKFYYNDYALDSTWLESEYDEDVNANMWTREPLKLNDTFDDETTSPPSISEPDEWSRWDGIGCNTPLFHVEIVDEELVPAVKSSWKDDILERGANPDAVLHSQPDGYDKPYHSTSIYNENGVMTYVFDGIWKRKLDLSVQEYGSTSAMVTQMMAKNNVEGSFQWTALGAHEFIEGIFWQKFDTFLTKERTTGDTGTLTQQYRITYVPKYTPDQEDQIHSGPLFHFTEGEVKECEVYLFPRRWMYYGRWQSCDYKAEEMRGLVNYEASWDSEFIDEQKRLIPCCYRTSYTENNTYNHIFALWGRPPRDYWLPRRTEFDPGTIEGTMGGEIPASRMSGTCGAIHGDTAADYYDTGHEDFPGGNPYMRRFWDVSDDWDPWDNYRTDLEYTPDGFLLEVEDQDPRLEPLGLNMYSMHQTRNEDFFGWCNMTYEAEEQSGEYTQPAFGSEGCVRGLDDCAVDGGEYQFSYGRGGMQCLYLFNFNSMPYSDYADFYGGWEGYPYSYFYGWTLSDQAPDADLVGSNCHPWLLWGIASNTTEITSWHSWAAWIETPFGGVPIRTVYDKINTRRGGWNGMQASSTASTYWRWTQAYNRVDCFGEYGETFSFCMTAPDGGPIIFGDTPIEVTACEWSPDGVLETYPRVETYSLDPDIWTNGGYTIEAVLPETRKLYNGAGKYDDDEITNFHKLWNTLYNSEAVQDAIEASEFNQGSNATTDVPYIIGVAPTMKESLVAILRINKNEIFYVWKAEENEGHLRVPATDTDEECEAYGYHLIGGQMGMSKRGYLVDTESPPRTAVGYHTKACPEAWDWARKTGFLYSVYNLAQCELQDAEGNVRYYDEYQTGQGIYDTRYTENWGRLVYKMVYTDVDWTGDQHETFLGVEVEYLVEDDPPTYATAILPWLLYEGAGAQYGWGNNIVNENPYLIKEDVFTFDAPWYMMVYRKKALDGTTSPSYGSGYNVRRRCDEFWFDLKGDEGVTAYFRDRDGFAT